MSKLNVLVVGASVAGPMAAYWLAKAGAKITVIERFPELRKGGQNIDIRTSGVTIMRRIPGMEEAVRAKNTGEDGMAIVDADGRTSVALRATGDADKQSILSEFEIFRDDLSRILHDLTKDNENVKYVFGDQIASIQQRGGSGGGDGPVTVEFANGSLPPTDYDLVVACDGATSRTRAMAFECGVRDHIHTSNTWAAYFSIPGDWLAGSKIGLMHSVVGGRCMGVGPDPLGVTRVLAMCHSPSSSSEKPREDGVEQFRQAAKEGDEALRKFVARTFSDCGWKIPEILKAMMETDDFYASEIVTVKSPQLSKGRVVLVGDAGYASSFTGTGTTLAMTGAYTLAGEIASHKGDLAAAMQAYEDRMRPIITEYQKVPFIVPTAMAPQTQWGIWIRNFLFKLVAHVAPYFNLLGTFINSAGLDKDKTGIPEYKFEL